MAAANESTGEVVWTPGTAHPKFKAEAAQDEGKWIPLPGYVWVDDPPQIENVVWHPGIKHPDKNLISGDEEGQWEPPPGYSYPK